jgi:excinuclease ABC subunit A
VSHLAEAAMQNPKSHQVATAIRSSSFGCPSDFEFRPSDFGATLFLFDEPTTGLHFEDIRVLLRVFQRLVDSGHSVIVIEHNLDVIKCADWIIDLGPGAGDEGGRIVAEGAPEQIARCAASFTGRALKTV